MIRKIICKENEVVTLIYSDAVIGGRVSLGKETIVVIGAIIDSDTVIDDGCIIYTVAFVDHDCVIEDYSHVYF